ncbi:hypothetical protein JTB14_010622 [Gonioctena quinquepunctata]|nr:hypothetical protein JTB14_010622 [Gonioctena quinquepunctata]
MFRFLTNQFPSSQRSLSIRDISETLEEIISEPREEVADISFAADEKDQFSQSLQTSRHHIIIAPGHYNVPDFSEVKLLGSNNELVLITGGPNENPNLANQPNLASYDHEGLEETDQESN